MAEYNDSFGWDDEVETADASNFQLLNEGPCMFRVTDFKRGRFEGSAKMSACFQAELTLETSDPEGHVSDIHTNLPLNRKMQWKLTAFFKSIRLIDPDTPSGSAVRYPWDKIVGTRGMCEVEHYQWTGNDGQVRTGNSIKSFLFGDRSDDAAQTFATSSGQAMPKGQRPYGGTFL